MPNVQELCDNEQADRWRLVARKNGKEREVSAWSDGSRPMAGDVMGIAREHGAGRFRLYAYANGSENVGSRSFTVTDDVDRPTGANGPTAETAAVRALVDMASHVTRQSTKNSESWERLARDMMREVASLRGEVEGLRVEHAASKGQTVEVVDSILELAKEQPEVLQAGMTGIAGMFAPVIAAVTGFFQSLRRKELPPKSD